MLRLSFGAENFQGGILRHSGPNLFLPDVSRDMKAKQKRF